MPLVRLRAGVKGQSLREEWIAYICREILRVRRPIDLYDR